MKCMVFAAGLGTRLRPITDTLPKALVRVGEQTLLDITLSRLAEAGADEAVVNVHHHADILRNYIQTHAFPLRVSVSDESQRLLDTGGGLLHAAPFFGETSGHVLIHNVDILSNLDIRRFYAEASAVPVMLVTSQRETSRYLLFDEGDRLVGWTNVKTGEVKSPYADIVPANCRHLAFNGIHAFSPALFPLLKSFAQSRGAADAPFSIIDFYLAACRDVQIKAYTQPDLKILDVGKVDALRQAEAFLQNCSK